MITGHSVILQIISAIFGVLLYSTTCLSQEVNFIINQPFSNAFYAFRESGERELIIDTLPESTEQVVYIRDKKLILAVTKRSIMKYSLVDGNITPLDPASENKSVRAIAYDTKNRRIITIQEAPRGGETSEVAAYELESNSWSTFISKDMAEATSLSYCDDSDTYVGIGPRLFHESDPVIIGAKFYNAHGTLSGELKFQGSIAVELDTSNRKKMRPSKDINSQIGCFKDSLFVITQTPSAPGNPPKIYRISRTTGEITDLSNGKVALPLNEPSSLNPPGQNATTSTSESSTDSRRFIGIRDSGWQRVSVLEYSLSGPDMNTAISTSLNLISITKDPKTEKIYAITDNGRFGTLDPKNFQLIDLISLANLKPRSIAFDEKDRLLYILGENNAYYSFNVDTSELKIIINESRDRKGGAPSITWCRDDGRIYQVNISEILSYNKHGAVLSKIKISPKLKMMGSHLQLFCFNKHIGATITGGIVEPNKTNFYLIDRSSGAVSEVGK